MNYLNTWVILEKNEVGAGGFCAALEPGAFKLR